LYSNFHLFVVDLGEENASASKQTDCSGSTRRSTGAIGSLGVVTQSAATRYGRLECKTERGNPGRERAMSEAIKLFISHKMPKDSDAASSIGQLLALYSGSKIKIILAEDFQKGGQLTPEITAAIQSADIFILLYTGEDQDWGYCMLEAGRFQAILKDDENEKRSIVVLHDPGVSKPKALSQYISVPVSEKFVYQFLNQLYVGREIFPDIDPSFLHKAALDICKAFHKTDVLAINFDLIPSFSIELENSEMNSKALEDECLPGEALFMGTQDWQFIFGRDAATGAWKWADLSKDWVDGAIYEPELARMLRTAIRKDAPQGCFIRPHKSDELYRLTLRRYEEIEDASRLRFYFTAAPIDIPIFGIHDTTNKRELTLYNMINITWYARRKLIDQLYCELLSYVNSTQDEPLRIAETVINIKNELRSIDIQTNIRRISRPMDVSNLQPLEKTMQDQLSWDQHREEIFEYSKQSPMNIKGMAASLYQLAVINRNYYQMSATQYAEVAKELQLPPAPPS
jgi:TIR domain